MSAQVINIVLAEPNRPILKYFNKEMGEIYLEPDLSLTSSFEHNKAAVGILKTAQWRLPVGVAAWIWSDKDRLNLSKSGRFALTFHVLKTAWVTPFVTTKHFRYQIGQAVVATFVITLVHPIYELGWQAKRLFKKLFS